MKKKPCGQGGKKEETVWREKEEIQIVAVGQGTTSC
jgi:hypothetical protein